jgi:hypothetical protein
MAAWWKGWPPPATSGEAKWLGWRRRLHQHCHMARSRVHHPLNLRAAGRGSDEKETCWNVERMDVNKGDHGEK